MNMKKIIFTLIAIILVAATYFFIDRPKISFEQVALDSIVTVGGVNYEFTYDFASIVDAKESLALEIIEESNIKYFYQVEQLGVSPIEAARININEIIEANGNVDKGMGWENTLMIESRAVIVDTILVYEIEEYSFTGGAHGMATIEYHNYSLGGGYEIALADVMDTDKQASAAILIREKLYNIYGVTDDAGLKENCLFPEYINVSENFKVTHEGITFHYNQYDIACYAAGPIEVSISKSELEAL